MPSPAFTCTGTLENVTGSGVAGSVTFLLCNYGDNAPLISGTALLCPIAITAIANGSGVFSQLLYGNDQIAPSNTYYQVSIITPSGTVVLVGAYQFTGSGGDLSNLTPIIPPSPGVTIPTTVWSFNEVPSGTINGSNPVFTLAHAPSPSSSLMLFLNSSLLTAGIGFTLAGNTVTMQPSYIPYPGNTLISTYTYAP